MFLHVLYQGNNFDHMLKLFEFALTNVDFTQPRHSNMLYALSVPVEVSEVRGISLE